MVDIRFRFWSGFRRRVKERGIFGDYVIILYVFFVVFILNLDIFVTLRSLVGFWGGFKVICLIWRVCYLFFRNDLLFFFTGVKKIYRF